MRKNLNLDYSLFIPISTMGIYFQLWMNKFCSGTLVVFLTLFLIACSSAPSKRLKDEWALPRLFPPMSVSAGPDYGSWYAVEEVRIPLKNIPLCVQDFLAARVENPGLKEWKKWAYTYFFQEGPEQIHWCFYREISKRPQNKSQFLHQFRSLAPLASLLFTHFKDQRYERDLKMAMISQRENFFSRDEIKKGSSELLSIDTWESETWAQEAVEAAKIDPSLRRPESRTPGLHPPIPAVDAE